MSIKFSGINIHSKDPVNSFEFYKGLGLTVTVPSEFLLLPHAKRKKSFSRLWSFLSLRKSKNSDDFSHLQFPHSEPATCRIIAHPFKH